MSCIAIVIDTLSGGGAEQVMLRLASALISRGHHVRLVVVNPIISHSIPQGVQLSFVYKSDTPRGWKLTYYRRTAGVMQKILDELNKQQKIDALISNLPETDKSVQYLERYPIYYCIHNSFYHGQVKNKKGPIRRYLKKKKLQSLYNGKNLIFVSKAAENDLLKGVGVKPKSTQVIYNPFPIDDIRRLAQAYTVHRQNYFLHVGRFNRQKRHDKLLRLYAESGLANPLLLIGEGTVEQTEELKKLVADYGLEDRVELMGFNQNPLPYFRHAIALLLTSDYEGLPTAVIEALVCGTPVVAYDCPSGLNEILTGALDEYLVPFDDSSAFIHKIKSLAGNPKRIAESDLDLRCFEANNIAEQYLDKIRSEKYR